MRRPTIPPTRRVDIDVDALTAAFVDGDRKKIRDFFASHSLGEQSSNWKPEVQDLPQPEMRFLLTYWTELRGLCAMPDQASFDPVALRGLLGSIMLMDVLDEGRDFHYRVYGSWIAQGTGFDMTGKLLSAVPVSAPLASFFIAGYRAVVRRQTPLWTIHQPPREDPVGRWSRLILPLTSKKGEVTRLLVGNLPS